MKMTTLEITTYRIKRALDETGLTQAELARRVGISQQSVQKWVHGLTSPTTANLDKLSEILGYPPYWFMLPPEQDEDPLIPAEKTERELLQIFSVFPEKEKQKILAELKEKKEDMEKLVAEWLAAQKGRSA